MQLDTEAELQRRCDRNRKRSKRRAIYCPIHGCHLDSVSQKHRLFADRAGQLQARGVGRRTALLTIATHTAVPLADEWLEAFWCPECGESKWYHIHKVGDRAYEISIAPQPLWQQVQGVIHPHGNPSVSEFTRRQARRMDYNKLRDFQASG